MGASLAPSLPHTHGDLPHSGWATIGPSRLEGKCEVAQEVELASGGEGKIRSFWVGLGLTIITLGIYGICWYYFVNNELKDIGQDKGDQNLAQSSPAMSAVAILVGGYFIVPPLLSVYNYGQRIRRAQRLSGIDRSDQIDPIVAFLLLFPGGLLVVPYFIHFWYVTKHQNAAVRAAGGLPAFGAPLAAASGSLPGVGAAPERPGFAEAPAGSESPTFSPPTSPGPGTLDVPGSGRGPSDSPRQIDTPQDD